MINATLSLLKDGFSKRYESGNSQHEELKKLMDSIAEGAGALEILAANPDPEQSLDSHSIKLGRAGPGRS
ncbi:MAG: hypothetical protein Q7T53_09680 [Deltaproteobacteria bacterium]|nr:hypothetical protein [Deltaproteobacteria bacterium]